MTLHSSHDSHGRDNTFLVGLLAGAAVGGGLALLFAPRQGVDTRQGIASGAREASRKLTDTYSTVADSARRNAQRWASQAGAVANEWSSRLEADGGWPEDRAATPSEVHRAATADATYTPSQNASPVGNGLGSARSSASIFNT
ncbi:MAG TPA: YtxH domain-containing protein [Luteitalea sp.]|nr:YtxH domain-containing protein [Luteitalea sp.]